MNSPAISPVIDLDSCLQSVASEETFITGHNLLDNPTLSVEKLSEVIQRLPANQVFFSSAQVSRDADFDRAWIEHRSGFSLEDALQDLQHSDSYIMVRSPESDQDIQPLFEMVKDTVSSGIAPVDPDMHDAMLYLFISSPNSVTPFHVDRYSTFLMQLAGTKTVYVWPPGDRQTVPEEALETLFYDAEKRSPTLPEDREGAAHQMHLTPGQTLHIPFIAPHWVKNGPEVSVSLSIIYRTRKSDRRMNAYKLNHQLRHRLGWTPQPVGSSGIRDSCKDLLLRGYQKMHGH